MKESPVDTAAAAASAALKVTMAGSATAAAGEWWLSSEMLAFIGVVIGVVGLCAQIFYLRAGHRLRSSEYDMRKSEHHARMAAISTGATGPTTPGPL